MEADWEGTSEGGGGNDSIGKVLPRGSPGGTIVWSGDMSARGDNESEDRGITCDFLRHLTCKQATRRRDGS